MKHLLILSFLFLGACTVHEPTQVESPGLPAQTRHVDQDPITTNCLVVENDVRHTKVTCSFYNGSYSVSSLCIQVSFLKHTQDELVYTSLPFCSEALTPRANMSLSFGVFSTEHTSLSHACGRNLDYCYMRVEPVKQERIL